MQVFLQKKFYLILIGFDIMHKINFCLFINIFLILLAKAQVYTPEWSVTKQKNIAWTVDLPEVGQSGIAATSDKLFLSCYSQLADNNEPKNSANITLYCYSQKDGKMLWSDELKAKKPMNCASPYSDSTSPTPITDGQYVWCYNSSGSMACWKINGEKVWSTVWTERPADPYTRQYSPIISGDIIYAVHSETELRPNSKKLWCFLHAYNKLSGEHLWKSEDALTVHNRPAIGEINGTPVVFISRGGPHNAPEKPYGISAIDANTGKTIWRYDNPNIYATVNQGSVDGMLYATSALKGKAEELFIIDKNTGKEIKSFELNKLCKVTRYAQKDKTYKLETEPYKVNLVRFANKIQNGYFWFIDSRHFLGRLNLTSGEIELLEVPLYVDSDGSFIWDKEIENDMQNSRGFYVAGDKRSIESGWAVGNTRFWSQPVQQGKYLLISSQMGLTYVVDTTAEKFEQALICTNDLGPMEKTWSNSAPLVLNDKVFHRSTKQLSAFNLEKK
jgi:outer membrane protein assembly factor BamB